MAEPDVVELGGGQRGRQFGELHERVVDPVGHELGMQQPAEAVVRQRTEERHRAAQPTSGTRGVERPPAQLGGHLTMRVDDQVDQRFSTNDDHVPQATVRSRCPISSAPSSCAACSAAPSPSR